MACRLKVIDGLTYWRGGRAIRPHTGDQSAGCWMDEREGGLHLLDVVAISRRGRQSLWWMAGGTGRTDWPGCGMSTRVEFSFYLRQPRSSRVGVPTSDRPVADADPAIVAAEDRMPHGRAPGHRGIGPGGSPPPRPSSEIVASRFDGPSAHIGTHTGVSFSAGTRIFGIVSYHWQAGCLAPLLRPDHL